MKINYTRWQQMVAKSNPFYISEIRKIAELANNYNLSEERDKNLERKFQQAINSLARNDVFEFENTEKWKEKEMCFYEFCKAI